MARQVTISTIGMPQLRGGASLTHQACMDKMTAYLEREIEQVLPDAPDLIVLPEACDRFIDHTKEETRAWYRYRGDRIRDFLADIARNNRCYIAYSASRQEANGTWRNATQMLDRTGKLLGAYHKNYPMVEETTQSGILCGLECPLFQTDFGSVACVICFDLNFDELRLRVKASQPDLILFSSAYHGGLMQPYWAYSCRAHFVSAIFGTHPSQIIDPLGDVLAHTTNYFDHVTAQVNLDCAVVHLDYHWEKLTAIKQAYGRGVTIKDPGFLGSVLITSNMPDKHALDIVRDYELELLDDYWQRATRHRFDNLEEGP